MGLNGNIFWAWTGRILRAACPVNANEEDVLLLREMLQITRLVGPLDQPMLIPTE